jgi:AraC-like DNA-binding protein
MINVAGIGVCLIFLLFILNHKKKTAADAYLAAINVILALFLGLDIVSTTLLSTELVMALIILPYFLFPFYFYYGLEIIHYKPPYRFILFLPTIGLVVFMLLDFYIFHTRSQAYAEQIFRYPTLLHHVFYKGELLFTIAGGIWFLKQIKKYQRGIRDVLSYIEPMELQWLKHVTVAFLCITCLSLLVYLIYNFNTHLFDIELANKIVNGFSVLAIFYMSYHGIRLYAMRAQPKETVTLSEPEPLAVSERKYIKNALPHETLQNIHERLLVLFEKEKPYLEPQLQLQELAQRLEVGTHALSQTINILAGKSFYDFVNHYRIDHFKKLLAEPKNRKFSILALGLDSGFNSKASMNRIFKELTGQSPSAFQKMTEKEASTGA